MAGLDDDANNWYFQFTSDPEADSSSVTGLLHLPQSSSSFSSALSSKLLLRRPMADLLPSLRKKLSSERPPPIAPPSTPVLDISSSAKLDRLEEWNGSDVSTENGDFDASTVAPHQDSEPHPKTDTPPRRHLPPFIAALQPYLYLTLINYGSVARDHLASERTFLAYVRTSLAMASTGVALVQLFTISAGKSSGTIVLSNARGFEAYVRPLGATIVILGMLVLAVGVVRYFTIQSALTKGKFPVARTVVVGVSFAMGVIVIIAFAVLVSVKRTP